MKLTACKLKWQWTNSSTAPGVTDGTLVIGFGSAYRSLELNLPNLTAAMELVKQLECLVDRKVADALSQSSDEIKSSVAEMMNERYL